MAEINSFVDMTGLTYCGKEAEEIFTKQLYESDVHSYGVRYLPNVKGKQKLTYGEVGEMFQEYSCPFTPQGSAKLSESFIEPVAIKVNLEQCYSDFWPTYLVEQTEISLNGGIPQDFYQWFFNNVFVKELKKEYEEIAFNGDTAHTGTSQTYLALADGWTKIIKDDANSKKVTAVALTTANVLAKVGEVAEAILDMEDVIVDDFKIFMNHMDYRKLVTALGDAAISSHNIWNNFAKVGDKIYAYGFEVVPSRIAKSTMIATHPKNLVLGYDVANSEVAYKIVDMRESTLDNMFRVAVITNIALGVIYPDMAVVMA